MKKIFLMFLIFACSGLAQAQFNKIIEINSYADDNLYRSPDPVSDVLTNLYLGLSYKPEAGTINYYYDAHLFLYQEAVTRNFHLHEIGFDYYSSFGKQDQNYLYAGAAWLMRFDQEDYSYYDYNQLNAYLNLRFNFNAMLLRTGYNFRYREYNAIPELTNFLNTVFIQANKTLPTRTSIILEANLGYKSFATQKSSAYSSMGMGRGRNLYSSESSVSEIPSMQQAILIGRVAQSFHDKLGLYIQYRQQFNLSDQTAVLSTDSYYQDEELFDDPFGYESREYSSQLSWIGPWNTQLKINAGQITKNYSSEQAFISAADTTGLGGARSDDRNYLSFSLSKSYKINTNWLNLFSINFNYSYIKNASNSYWYDYKNSIIGAGVQFGF